MVADLLPVFLGLGVFIANAAVRELSTREGSRGPICCAGRDFCRTYGGLRMALCTWVRQQEDLPWKSALRLDAQTAYTGSLRYLERTSDSVFTFESASRPSHRATTLELVRQLASGSPSARVVTLWELRSAQHGSQAAHAVAKCLRDRQPAIRQEAALTLGSYGESARPELAPLMDLLLDEQFSVRSAAATALGVLGHNVDAVLPQLRELLRDPDHVVVASAGFALGNFGAADCPPCPTLVGTQNSLDPL